MTTERRIEMHDDDARARAAALAGRLAELGVTTLAIMPGAIGSDGWRHLSARSADLPGEILAALDIAPGGAPVELICPDLPLRFEIDREKTVAITSDAALARAFANH
ncbi:MAG: hypothetical protein EA376_13555 [Phycisphaeraceae bacterium]|nr:MAG: hypothetical protein EA376_13555 [Phycisphaeraceae bacterium]